MSYTITHKTMTGDAYVAQMMARAKKVGDEYAKRVSAAAAERAGHSASGGSGLAGAMEIELTESEKTIVWDIWCRAPFARYYEFGRDPGKPPPWRAMLPWVTKVFGLDGQEAESAARAVAINIGKFGTPPSFFMWKALIDASSELHEALQQEFAR
jgi:hypothetical protein